MAEPSTGCRVVAVGASNLTLGLSRVVDTARRLLGDPVEILAAHGPGRSYGTPTSVLGRRLPSIKDCGLWAALEEADERPTYALMTDIGNDILYEVPVEVILDWVRACLERLRATGAHTVLTLPPVRSVEGLSPSRYRLIRTLLFPRHRVPYGVALERTAQTTEALKELANSFGARVAELPASWYGFDPIHIRRRFRSEAWSDVLSRWPVEAAAVEPVGPTLRRQLYLVTRRPLEWALFGYGCGRSQPAASLPGGGSLALY